MRTKILAAFIAGGLLVGAGFVTSLISAPGTAQAQEETEDADGDVLLTRSLGFVGDVLDELVDDGTITSDQADAIVGAVRDKAGELKEQRRERLEDGPPHVRRHFREGFRARALLDDGGIDQGEYDSLGDNHPLKQVDVGEYLEDGLITPEELREIFHLEDTPFDHDS